MIFENQVDAAQLADLRQMVAPITIEEDLEGNDISNKRLKIGLRAGPENCITHALHEISHFIEIDRRRMHRKNWGLKHGRWVENPFPSAYCCGWYERVTDQHIQREMRVWAIQYNLSVSRGIKANFLDFGETADYLADIEVFVKAKDRDERAKIIAAKIEEIAFSPEYNINKILEEFDKRKKILIKKYKKG